MESLKPGLLRVAAACLVALLLETPSASPGAWLPYLAVGLAATYGVLLASGRSGKTLENGLVILLIDSFLVTVLVGSTGGQGSPFFPLYLLAALGVYRAPSIALGVAGTAAVSGGYLVAVLLADGPAAILPSEVGPRVGLIALFCAVAASAGAKLRGFWEHGRALSSTLDAERGYGEKVAALIPELGRVLKVLSLEGVLRRAAEAARGSLGVPYAHAATREGEHGTSAGGAWTPTPPGGIPRSKGSCCTAAGRGRSCATEESSTA